MSDSILPELLIQTVFLKTGHMIKSTLFNGYVYMLKINLRFSWVLVLLLSACDQSDKITPTITLNPEPASIDYNATFNMSWTATAVDYCIASGDWTGNIKSSGSRTLGPLTRDSFFILSCYHSGDVISESVEVKVRSAQIPQVNLSASPLSIAFQDSTTITWSSKHVEDCIAAGDWSGEKEPNGSLTIEGLESASEFRLVCSGAQGEIIKSVSIDVGEEGIQVPRVNLTAIPATISHNGSTTLSWETLGADFCRASGDWFGSKARSGMETSKQLKTDSRFILTCSIAGGGGGEGGDAAEVRVRPAPPPVVTLTANPPEVALNGATTLRWSSSHAQSCIAVGDWSGTKSISGTLTINGLEKSSMFSLKCTGSGGLGSGSVTVTLIDDNV
jgi:hypothetical protein